MNPDKENHEENLENAPREVNPFLSSEDGSGLELFYFEEVRLKTFRNWPLTFIKPEDLAINGFYYPGRGDEVRCPFCRVEIMRWERNDKPAQHHHRWAPNCPFLKNPATSGNVPLNPNIECSVPTKGPTHPQYESLAARLRSFDDWPTGMKQSPEALAEAGFFYDVENRTVCFYCGGGLKDWESSDVPWEEHARWLYTCPYVRLEKGSDYIQKVLEAYEARKN